MMKINSQVGCCVFDVKKVEPFYYTHLIISGWYDCPLSSKGQSEAIAAGKLLKDSEFQFDIAYTSYLQRAIRTLWYVLEETELMYIPIKPAWQLSLIHI